MHQSIRPLILWFTAISYVPQLIAALVQLRSLFHVQWAHAAVAERQVGHEGAKPM